MPKVREVEADVEVLPRETRADTKLGDDPFIALVARLMDEAFVIPGTNIRFGLDPLIGLLPGFGPVASSVISLALIGLSARLRVPKIILARMAVNVLLNAGLDAVPVVGDALSIFFRSNTRNHELLRKYAGTAQPASRGDWLFLIALLGGAGLAILAFFVGLFYLASQLFTALR
ncbi:MAG: DUF4112 domain-containing protein [Chthoniobacter sp.]|nr:DUF4112 domain-containing protein [Chthoniobacter sp.]